MTNPFTQQPVSTAKTAVPVMPAEVVDAAFKLRTIVAELQARFVERHEVATVMALAGISRHHMVEVGPGGEAKTNLAEAFTARITGATLFDTMLRPDSATEEVFGPVSVQGYKNDVYRRITDGTLVDAHIGYIDEIWNANAGIHQGMNGIMNERVFKMGRQRVQSPLEFVIGSSNVMPGGDDPKKRALLAPTRDRYLFWLQVNTLSDAGHREFMDAERERRQARFAGSDTSGKTGTTISLDELHLLQQYAKAVVIPDDVMDAWYEIRSRLREKLPNSVPSTRRSGWLLDAICAHAILNGRMVATEDDLVPLRHCLWNMPAEIREVAGIVLDVANPLLAEIVRLYDKLQDTVAETMTWLNNPANSDRAQRIAKLAETCNAISNDRKNGFGDRINDKIEQAKGRGRDVAMMLPYLSDSIAQWRTLMKLATSGASTSGPFNA